MDEVFVSIDLTEHEFDALVEWIGDQSIDSGLGKLYDRLIAATEVEES